LSTRILALGFNESAGAVTQGSIFSRDTVKGFDLILINSPRLFSDSDIEHIKGDHINRYAAALDHRVQEIFDQVRRGTVVAIFPAIRLEAVTLETQYYTDQVNNFDAKWVELHSGVKVTPSKGEHFDSRSASFERYIKTLEADGVSSTHRVCLLPPPKLLEGIRIPNNNDIIAGALRIGKGMIVFLPDSQVNKNYFLEYTENIWKLSQELLEELPEVSENIEDLPSWAHSVILPGEARIRERIAEIGEEILARQDELHAQEAGLEIRENVKRLFTESGDALEEAVEETMKYIGFTVDEVTVSEANKVDRIFRDGERALIMEIKGRETQGAKGADLSQLLRWQADFYESEEKAPDAALVLVNGYRKLPLGQRAGKPVFADNIIKDASKQNFGLLSGTQLVALRVAVEAGELSKEGARDALLSCVGLLKGFTQLEIMESESDSSVSSA
jgi:hypothetical protein